jgi:hypothetical protein
MKPGRKREKTPRLYETSVELYLTDQQPLWHRWRTRPALSDRPLPEAKGPVR